MASKLPDTTDEHTKYGRMCRMVVELCRDMLWELLLSKIPINELPQKVKQSQKIRKLHLSRTQLQCISKPGGDLPANTDVDISVLYTILRNICPKLKPPTEGWFDEPRGNTPGKKDVKIGDDIERIRIKRNVLYGHATEARMTDKIYKQEVADLREIASRMDSRLKKEFTKFLTMLENCSMDPEAEKEFTDRLLQQKLQDEEVMKRIEGVEDHIHNLQGLCTETVDDVGQLREKVKHLERVQKPTATNINITQNIGTATSEVTVHASTSGNSQQESTNASEITKTSDLRTTQTSKGSYASAVAKHLPTEPNPSVNVSYTKVNINISSSDRCTEDNQMGKFLSETSNFSEGHFILVTSEVERNKCLEELALVPWTAVFDFDPNSRTTGLLSVVEHKIPELTNHSLHINCLEDYNVNPVTENSTHWMFCRGCRENSNSRFTDEDWQQNTQLKAGVKSFVRQLKEFSSVYTNYKIIILWPTDDSAITSIYHLVDKLQKHVDGQLIVIDRNETISSEKSKSFQTVLSNVFKKRYSQISLKLEEVCKAINLCQAGKFSLHHSSYQLPTADKTNMINMTDKEASWLEEDFVILYLNKRHETERLTTKNLRKECEEFYKGGTLPWYMWYEVDSGHVDARRDCMDDLIKLLMEEYIQQYKSGMITVHHAPGSGGTTLAQRTLWELRKITPCVQVKLRTNTTLNDTVNRLQFLHEKTARPLLVLIDGEEDQKIRALMSYVLKICVVVLNMQRYLYPMKNVTYSQTCFWLSNTLSVNEANLFALKFESQCKDERKRQEIEDMATEVGNGAKKSIFEFGLAAYTYQFKGIEAYVKGYLNLQSRGGKLLPWQAALGMLSLAYFYGHIGLPCQFFAEMLGQQDGRSISVKEFPDNMQSLIVNDTLENRKNIIRISHYYVAKEILEQILPWPKPRLDKRQETLCIADKKLLKTFVISFIKEVEKNDKGEHGKYIIQILTSTFIIREAKIQQKDQDNWEWKTEQLSQIFQDLSAKAPYAERFAVMEQLTKSFPKDPHFHAHLGRLYAIFNPEKEKEAEQCFTTALEMCKKMSPRQNVEDMTYNARSTYKITHSMCANMFRRRIARYAGWNFNQNKPKIPIKEGQFEQVATKLLEMVQEGRKHFQKWRMYDSDESNIQFSFLGEIHICLMFCDFLNKKGGHPDITKYIEENDSAISSFAEECIYQIDELFLEFFSTIEPDDEFNDQVGNLQHWYYALFKYNVPIAGRLRFRLQNAHNKRLQIALLKLQNGKDNIYGVLENIQSKSDIEHIISSFEEIFMDVHESGIDVTRSSLDQDYKEWLVAIRHDLLQEPRCVEDVLDQVQKWYKKFHTPLSKFYIFVLKSILGFGNKDSLGNTQMLIEAQRLKTEIMKQTKSMVKSQHPREWLGMGSSIRQLVLSTRFYGQKEGSKDYMKPGSIGPAKLALMKGVIRHPNEKAHSGYISLDLGTENNVSVNAFFVPVNFNMHFKSFANEKVEFNLGFSYTYGYEAYNVERLQKFTCKACKLDIHATSRDSSVLCLCGFINPVVKD